MSISDHLDARAKVDVYLCRLNGSVVKQVLKPQTEKRRKWSEGWTPDCLDDILQPRFLAIRANKLSYRFECLRR
jgi:hypothetical protein